MTELILCPCCDKPTVKERKVYETEKIKQVMLEEYAKRELQRFQSGRYEFCGSGDIWIGGPIKTPVQLVYTCSTCGFTKVYDVTKE